MTSKEKQAELRKIKQTRDWVDLLSHIKEYEYDGERLSEELLRFYKHVNLRVLFWALDSYEEEVRGKDVK